MATGQAARSEETVTFAPDGPMGFLETIRTPIHDPAGTIIGVLGIGRDITQRKRDEDQIRRMTESLAEQVEEPASRGTRRGPGSQRMGHLDDLLNPMLAGRWDRHCQRLDLSAPTLQALEDLSLWDQGRTVRAFLAPALDAAGDHRQVSDALDHSLRLAQAFTGVPPERPEGEAATVLEDLDLDYANKLYAAFQRLHASQDFERIYLASSWANFCWISSSEKGLVIAKV